MEWLCLVLVMVRNQTLHYWRYSIAVYLSSTSNDLVRGLVLFRFFCAVWGDSERLKHIIKFHFTSFLFIRGRVLKWCLLCLRIWSQTYIKLNFFGSGFVLLWFSLLQYPYLLNLRDQWQLPFILVTKCYTWLHQSLLPFMFTFSFSDLLLNLRFWRLDKPRSCWN